MKIYVIKASKETITANISRVYYLGINEFNSKRVLILSGGHLDTRTHRAELHSAKTSRHLMSLKCFHEIAQPTKADIIYLVQ